MKNTLITVLIGLCAASCIAAQQVATVPRLVRISNTFHPANGQPAAPVEGVTLSIYRDEREGAPLWQETHNVSVDSEGRYSVLLGATLNDGLPMELFASGEPRWLGVRFNRPGEVEQQRTLLTSVPYALRASDAETLGGLPASAFLRDPSAGSSSQAATAAATANLAPNAPKPRVNSGTAGFIGMFTDATDLGDSSMYQTYGTRIGLNTAVPYDYFHVQFNDSSGVFTGYAVQNINAAGFSGMQFYDQNGALAQFQGFGNTTHEYRINNIASGGSINFLIGSNSKFYLANSGNVGISNPTPGYALDVAGDINLSGSLRYQGTPVLKSAGGASANLAVGLAALGSNTTGNNNTASGQLALYNNTAGDGNTAVGAAALLSNIIGSGNTAIGSYALYINNGNNNTATGVNALAANTTGFGNTASGVAALANNTTGSLNTATGYSALINNSTGGSNTAGGNGALFNNVTGSNNTALGLSALGNNETGGNNIAIGYEAASAVSYSNSNNIHIGSQGASADSGTIRLGTPGTQTSFYVAGVSGDNLGSDTNAVPVVIDTTTGLMGVTSSSRRYKQDIQDMGTASRNLMRLRPVTFRYEKPAPDGSKPMQYGLIAEEVAEVYPDLVARSADGQIETVRYQVLDSMLLNEVQRLENEVQDLRAQLKRLALRNP